MISKGIIFDMDGTLLDSMPSWSNVSSCYLEEKNIFYPNDIEEIVCNMSFPEVAQYFIELGLNLTADEIMKEISNIMDNKYRYEIPLKPHVKTTVRKLKKMGIKMCVNTASSTELAITAFKRLEILDCFEFVLSCNDVGKSKREPDIYLISAEKMNLEPHEVTVFEDAFHCIQTVKKAGFITVGVYDDSYSLLWEDIKKTSDYYIHSFKEIV